MVSYVNSFTAIAGCNLCHIPYRDELVLALGLAGLLMLAYAASVVARTERTPILLQD